MKKILVTGASGLLGRHLCEYLSSRGFKVTGTAKMRRGRKPAKPLIDLDVLNREQVAKTIARLKPYAVIHLAGQTVPRKSWEAPDATFAANTLGTLNVLNALRLHSPKTRLIFASTAHVYGKTLYSGRPATEESVLWPETPYGASKAAAELACVDFSRRFGLDTVIVRPVNFIGPGQSPEFVFADWCRQIALAEKRGKPAALQVGNILMARDFLHVTDVARALETLILKGRTAGVYNVSSGKPKPLRGFAEFLVKKSRIPLRIHSTKSRLRRFEPPSISLSSKKLHALGWRPKHSVYDALEEMLAEWRSKT